jgi:hypothetical protein
VTTHSISNLRACASGHFCVNDCLNAWNVQPTGCYISTDLKENIVRYLKMWYQRNLDYTAALRRKESSLISYDPHHDVHFIISESLERQVPQSLSDVTVQLAALHVELGEYGVEAMRFFLRLNVVDSE